MNRRYKYLTLLVILSVLIWLGPGLLSWTGGIIQSTGVVYGASDPVIAAAGDIACDPSNANFKNGNGTSANCRQLYTSNLLVNAGFAAVLALGDNQYYCGGYAAFVQSYDLSWGRILSITHPTVGNHEYLTSGGTDCNSANAGAAGYFKYFGSTAGPAGLGYYSFDIGTWHIISLDTNCSNVGGCAPNTPQGKWLAADLAAHQNYCTLAYWHIPLFSSGGRAAQNSLTFWQQLYNANADLILNGHDHIYERFAPQTSTGALDTMRGIREFIVGTGGSDHTTTPNIAANSEVRNANTFGVLKLTLHPTSYDWQFVPEAGGTFTDSGTQACHSSTLPTPTATATTAASATPTATLAASSTATATATPTATLAARPTATATATSTPTLATSPTATATSTPTATPGTSPTATATATPTATLAASPTPTATTQASTVFSDGFESGNLVNWTTVQSLVVQSQVVDTGSFAARATSAGGTTGVYARKTLSAPQIDLYYRIHLNVLSMAANTFNVIKFRTAANVSILSVSINNLGNLSYHNDITGTSVNSTTRVNLGAWQSLEVHLHIADTASLIETWYNGSPVAAMTRTDSFGTTPTGILQLGENTPGMTYDVAYDDVVAATGMVTASVPLAVGPASPQANTPATLWSLISLVAPLSTPLVMAAFRNINRRH